MKSFKYLACVSAITFALIGCSKKDSPEPQAQADIEVTTPEVVERTEVICDDIGLKNRVVSLVREEMYATSVNKLGNEASDELTQQLRARLSGLEVDLQNVSEDDGECRGQLHVVLPNEEVSFANRTFSGAGVPSLEDQAVEKDVSLMGGNRLVGDFVFLVDGEALNIDKSSPVLTLASETMATAVRTMNRQNKANAKRETAQIGKTSNNLIPAPEVQIRPVELPAVPEIPRPEEAILRPEDVPSGTPKKSETKTEVKSETKSEAKPEPKPETKSEAKPEPKTDKPAGNEITIIETDETY